MFASFLNPIIVMLSLSTTTGIIVHDTKIDKAASVALAAPIIAAAYQGASSAAISSDPHTHVERVSAPQSLKAMSTQNPTTTPRVGDKKHLLQRHSVRGQQAFDGCYVPLA